MTRTLTTLITAGLFAAALAPTEAEACGGFFCFTQPIDQSKERIIFAIDEDAGTVDVHVQIFYAGDAEKFSWIVPVPAVPEVKLSTDALFAQLAWQTQPSYYLNWEERGTCSWERGGGWYYGPETDDANAPSAGGGNEDGGVEVLASGKTGPFDWVVVGATDAKELVLWLGDPDGDPGTADGYTIPSQITPKLAPYLADGAKFIAFKLESGASAGDISPIHLQYASTKASIPIVLTSIAATPDMRLEPYVFATKRAVPENYLHVQVNEAAVNWLDNGQNYESVITQAANEAGGQAFATDFFGPTTPFRNQLFSEGRFDLDLLRAASTPVAFVEQLLNQGFPRDAVMQNLLRTHIPMPSELVDRGTSEQEFYNCLGCFTEELADFDFDPDAFVEDLEERVVEPLRNAEALFHDYSHLTRLTSSMSPDEMTADPLFVLNADMVEPVSNIHQATLVIDCGEGTEWVEAPRWIELSDGRIVEVPPETWFQEDYERYTSWIDDADQPAAAAIERTGATGQPQPISDNRPEGDANLDDYNNWVRGLTGRSVDGGPEQVAVACAGCNAQGGAGGAWAGLLLGLGALASRRRR